MRSSRVWGAAGGEGVAGEAELVDGGVVELFAVGGRLGAQDAGVARLEAHDAEQFGDVDMFGGEAAAQHVVGVGHDLDAEAVEVGVRDACSEVEGFAGLEPYVVEQHGGDDAGVAGVVVGEGGVGGVRVGVRAGFGAQAGGGGHGFGDGGGHARAVGGEDGGEGLAECGVLGVGAEDVDVGLEGIDAEGLDEVGRFGGAAEAAESVEGDEGDDHLGLVVGVPVVAVGCVDRYAPGFLVGETGLGLCEVGVDLQGEGAPAARSLRRKGSRGPKRSAAGVPRVAAGSASMNSLSGIRATPSPSPSPSPWPSPEPGPSGRSMREGAPGWAPIHSSA